eukprot:jgi/Mesen1/9429/ME000618S08816
MPSGGIAPAAGAGVQAYDGRVTAYVVFTCLVAASGGLLFGYDIGVTGGVTSMPDFLSKFFPHILREEAQARSNAWCKFNSQMLQLFTSSLFIAGLFGGLFASYTTTRWGRVRTMLISGIFFCTGALLTSLAPFLALLVIGRIFLGLGVGFANQMFQLATTIGILAAQLINYGTQNAHPWGWRMSLGLAGVPALLLTIGGLTLPETPNSLIERNRLEQGRKTLQKIRGVDVNVQAEYDDILSASQRASEVRRPFLTIFRKEYRPELTFAILIPFFQQVTGINAIMFYVAPLFNTLGFGESTALYSAVITGAVNVLATLVSILTVDRLGRKKLFLVGGIQMFLMQIATGVTLGVAFGKGDKQLSSGVSALVVTFICIYVAGFAWSWGPLGWLVPSEIQPLDTRSAGQSITVATNFLFTFIIGQAFLSMLCGMKYGIFLFFAAFVLIMTIFIHLCLPETKGVPLEEMVDIWRNHWFWRNRIGEKGAAADRDVEMRTGTQPAPA